jgi:hypothetical protein
MGSSAKKKKEKKKDFQVPSDKHSAATDRTLNKHAETQAQSRKDQGET